MTEAKKYVVYVYTDYRKEIRTRVVRVYDTLGQGNRLYAKVV